jgi:hypothetical protein
MSKVDPMTSKQCKVSTTVELLAAVADASSRDIEIVAPIVNVPSFRLSAGQRLSAANAATSLHFAAGQDGLQVSTDNHVENLHLIADLDRRAIFNDTGVASFGQLALRNLRITGAVQLLARDRLRGGHIDAHDIDVVAADARGYQERPKGYGVEVIPGAFTLWNQHVDPTVTITADLMGLRAGRAGAPVRGSGIFVGGGGDDGGALIVLRLETAAVHSDGGIAKGTPDRISGGVFVVSGAVVDEVHNRGPVTTYGPNDMVLDNWGAVDTWIADEKITSYGPSGIGFVNFGSLNLLQVNAPIETFGQGARGFNVYAGTLRAAEFERVVTHADGAVGVQISQPVDKIVVRRGIETFGGTGDSLVKGVVVKLAAIALSVKPGGSVGKVEIAGGLITHGDGVDPLELHGAIASLHVTEGFAAAGGGFQKI